MTSVGRVLAAVGAAVVVPVLLSAPAQALPLPTPSASSSPEPSEEPEPSRSASPSASPSQTSTAPRTAAPTTASTSSAPAPTTAAATASSAPVESPSAEPGPVVSEQLPLSSLTAPPVETSPSPEPVAVGRETPADPLERALQLALGTAAVLGIAGSAGLYLTREGR